MLSLSLVGCGLLAAAPLDLAVPAEGVLLTPAEPAGLSAGVAKPKVRFLGKNHAFDKLPDEVGDAARVSLEQWLPWIEAHDFHAVLSADQSVLLVLPKKSLVSKREKLLEEVLERFEEIAPRLGDLEADARPNRPSQELPAAALDSLPGQDVETAVLVELMGPKLADELGDYLAEIHADLRGWASTSLLGGVVSDVPPLSVTVDGDGQEEYEAENEVVHRLVRTLLARRFGLLPYTVQSGLAWALEEEICGDHYCFPFRNEFIFETEHGAWVADLKARYRSRRKEPLTAEELFEFQRGTFDLEPAQVAFGFGRYLIEERAEELPVVLDALRQEWASTVIRVDGSNWTYQPDREVAPVRVAEVCAEVLGADFAQDVTDYFRKGLR